MVIFESEEVTNSVFKMRNGNYFSLFWQRVAQLIFYKQIFLIVTCTASKYFKITYSYIYHGGL
jgi:hypothetical protein